MPCMRLDHVTYAAAPDGLAASTTRLGALLDESFVEGGVHPRLGTRNMVLPLAGGCYLEVVSVLDHPASDKAPFGQAVRARSLTGGGWLGYTVAVDDIAPMVVRLERSATPDHRLRPDGFDLRWLQIGVLGPQSDPQLPCVVQWEVDAENHPSVGASGQVRLAGLEIAGDPDLVSGWLGQPASAALDSISVDWVTRQDHRGLVAAWFSTAAGDVRI